MSKVFFTYEQQLDMLENEKGLIMVTFRIVGYHIQMSISRWSGTYVRINIDNDTYLCENVDRYFI